MCLKSKEISNFTGRINAFQVIECLERMYILGGQNTESVNKISLFHKLKCFFNLPIDDNTVTMICNIFIIMIIICLLIFLILNNPFDLI